MFRDRTEAGKRLAAEVAALALRDPVVLALPRGGVPVAWEVAQALAAPLDLVIVRKVGAPGNPELAAASIVDGDPPDLVPNPEIVAAYGLDDADLRAMAAREQLELERRRRVYRAGRPPLPVAGRTAVLVDDGAATGTSMKAAVRAIRRRAPAAVVVALPVASSEAVAELSELADRVVCLDQPPHFEALGYHYGEFHQLRDAEVLDYLARASAGRQPETGKPS
ncbi:MAG: phosphoribosyltransferase [Rhizobiales bacterium]|nr:phosphoribosyltransferase [Hyphomicrobiales bacterium]OJU29697.1 MAG: phosphoribosyltransferase [Rhizobiales bacterium 68-8]